MTQLKPLRLYGSEHAYEVLYDELKRHVREGQEPLSRRMRDRNRDGTASAADFRRPAIEFFDSLELVIKFNLPGLLSVTLDEATREACALLSKRDRYRLEARLRELKPRLQT